MKTLSKIMSLLCLLSAFVFSYAGIVGFYLYGIKIHSALAYIALMVFSVSIAMMLLTVNKKSWGREQ